MLSQALIDNVIAIAMAAGDAIMKVYESQERTSVSLKADSSPLTAADLAAHRVIVEGLSALNESHPILSEESADISWQERKQWSTYWLVDPLDGTKEFIKGNGEFTVNIALVHDGVPLLGVVYAPVLNRIFWGAHGQGAWQRFLGQNAEAIRVRPHQPGEKWKVVGSRSHPSAEMTDYLAQLGDEGCEVIAMGSSLKLCLVATGEADLYPRLGPTSEWDTAAAHGVLLAAGGEVVTLNEQPLVYNRRESLLNPYFVARPSAEQHL